MRETTLLLVVAVCAQGCSASVIEDVGPGSGDPDTTEDPSEEDVPEISTGDLGDTDGGETPTPSFDSPDNPFGIGLVGVGDALQWDRTAELTGRGGHIKLIFAGVEPGMTTAKPEWHTATAAAYDRDLVPVIRIAPGWGDLDIRSTSDDAAHLQYTGIAAAYAAVIDSLPKREGWPLIIEVHNEPNLCYEWLCDPSDVPSHPQAPEGWIHYTTMAREYAAFLRDVTDAIHALGDERILVLNGALAPGGAVACQCGGDEFNPGITGLDYMNAMLDEVPDIFERLDGLASHPYPASGVGYGFFESYEQSVTGLHYYESELDTIGVDLPVYITETGWPIDQGANGSREEVADWTVDAFANEWVDDPRIAAVMPFMLKDPAWHSFAWIDENGAPFPVFTALRAWRCEMEIPEPCS